MSLPYVVCFLVLLVFACGSGCSRSAYRQKADHDAYDLVSLQEQRLDLPPEERGVDPGEESRLSDPEDPDDPPMPEDDPVSRAILRGNRGSDARPVEPPQRWKDFLPGDGKGTVVLNLHDAVEVAARNSRDFQGAREELYLSALDLSEQRYRFAPHLSLGTTASGTARGEEAGLPRKGAALGSAGGLAWMGAWGTELLARVVNTIIWDFDKPKLRTATSLIDFAIVQPLMRFGGRARVLEPLTQSERHLLANVRRMEQYQQGFYLDVVAGRDPAPGPARSVNAQSTAPALLAGSPSGIGGVPRASGYLGLLEEQQRIRNLESNVAGLRSSLAQLEAAFEAGRASSLLQVLQARSALQNAQSSLLTARAGYESRVDGFKTSIGLPPTLPLVVRDSFLTRFSIFDPATTELQTRINTIAGRLHDRENVSAESLRAALGELRGLRADFAGRFSAARRDLVIFSEALPARERQMESLRRRPEAQALESGRFDPKTLKAKAVESDQALATLQRSVDGTFGEIEAIEKELPALEFEAARSRASVAATALSGEMLELSLEHASAKIEAIALPPADLEQVRAIEIAKTNRLDWMNARAELVDA
ncbi:MAG: TolC family protein, partial [Chthoniobacteraceae bacterium]